MKKKYILQRPSKAEQEEKVRCTACNGSGHYDNDGSPKCGSCNGTGKKKD